MTKPKSAERSIMESRMRALYREAERQSEIHERLAKGSEKVTAEARRANAAARAAEAEANAIFWMLDYLDASANRAAHAEHMRQIEVQRVLAEKERDVTAANAKRREAETQVQRINGNLRKTQIDNVIAEILSETTRRGKSTVTERESCAVFAALYDRADDYCVSTSLSELSRTLGLHSTAVRRALARLHSAGVIEAQAGAAGMATFRLICRRKKEEAA